MVKKNKLPVAKATPLSEPCVSTKADKDRERRWRAEDALRTCEQYEKNKADKQLMADVKKLAREKMNDLKRVAGK